MAPTRKLYPRSTIKRIIKAHSKRSLSKNVDILVSVAYHASSTWLIYWIDLLGLRAFLTRVRASRVPTALAMEA